MTGDLLINGKDAHSMGIAMGDGFLSALLTPCALKSFIENDDPTKNGKEIIIPTYGEEGAARVQDRDVVLTFTISGNDPAAHRANYNAFVALLQAGKLMIQVPKESQEIYRLYYLGTSGSYMLFHI